MISRLGKAVDAMACVVLFFMMLISVIDVAGRNLLRIPLPGASELVELAMVVTVFLVYPRVALKNAHICIDLFDGLMNDLAKRVQCIVANLLGAVLFAAIAWRLGVLADRTASYGDVTGYLRVPMSVVFAFMALMSGVTVAAFLSKIRPAFRPGRFSLATASQEHN